MVCLGRPYHFKFFKDCLPQILLGPFLNILSQMLSSKAWEMIGNENILLIQFFYPVYEDLNAFFKVTEISEIRHKNTSTTVKDLTRS